MSARGAAAQCGAMSACALLSLRPLLLDRDLLSLARAVPWLAAAAGLAALACSIRKFYSSIDSAGKNDAAAKTALASAANPFAARPARRWRMAAHALAAVSIIASLATRLHTAQVDATPALFWLAALAAGTLAAWTCMHLRPSLVRARFYWALALGMLLAVIATLDRPNAIASVRSESAAGSEAKRPTDSRDLEPGPSFNIALAVGTLLLAEGHPEAELFALAPLYAPASSAVDSHASSTVDSRAPAGFGHLAALASSLFVGLFALALRYLRAGRRAIGFAATALAALALCALAIPLFAFPALDGAFDGAALWLFAGSAALFSPSRDAAHEGGAA